MYKLIITSIAAVAISGQVIAAELKTDKQKFSYFIGTQIGHQLKQDGIEIDKNAFLQALDDVTSGAESRISQEEMQAVMQRFQEAKQAEANKLAESNIKEGKAFLEANKNKEGVKTTASGLQYKVIKAGSGKKPSAQDVVEVHYQGTLIDGTVFDSSYKRNQPAQFPVGGVIPGWTEALQLMKEGAKWQLFIPSDLAYGPRGTGGPIGPNATLIFDVELLAVKAKQ